MTQFLKNKEEIQTWLEENVQGGYEARNFKINSKGVISSDSRVTIKLQLDALPVKFGKVKAFNCQNVGLKTLEGCPNIVEELFDCSYNELTNLVGGPQKAKSYHCFHNKLTSLKGAPQIVGTNFNCSYNLLETLEYITPVIGQSLHCEHNKLKTLSFSPKKVGSLIFAQFNEIEDWEENFEFFKEILLGKQRTELFRKFEDSSKEANFKFDVYKATAQVNKLKKELNQQITLTEKTGKVLKI